jgi:TP901 family phage tail tape measure protein
MKDAGSFDADLAVNMQFTVDSAGLVEMAKTVKEISKGKDLQNYWKDVESATDNAASAIKKYSKNINEKGLAENFLKQINALKALTKKENLSEIFPNMDVNFDELINSAKRLAPKINSEFSSNKFEQAFKTFDLLKEKGIDLGEAFRELSEYANLVDRNFRLNRENSELKNLIGDDDIEQIKKNLKEIQKLRQEAEDTFSSFLNINKIEKTDSWGDENFSEYFTEIRNGTLSATEAIGRFKVEYGHLLENGYKSSGDSFGLDQLQAFSTKLDSIFRQVEETSNKINDILSNGVIAKSVQNLSKDTTLPDSQRSIFGDILQDEESLKSITALFQKLIDETNQTKNTEVFNTEQFTKIESLFTSIESSLSSIKGVLVDVGDGEELSPLLKNINNVETAIDKLSSSVKGIGLNMNIDFGSNKELEAKAEAKISNALQAYQKLFEHLKLSSAGGSVINTKFFDFDINQFDTPMSKLQAYVKFIKDMREEAKQMFGGQDVLYTDTDKKIWDQASSAKGQVTKIFNEMKTANDINPLENLFGKTDLSGVIEQLNTIVSKLDEISVSAKGFVETFKNGLNVNASVEEIEKLTNRVKELEDELAEVKVPTALPSEESNISSGRKDAFPDQDVSASVESATNSIKEENNVLEQNTQKVKENTQAKEQNANVNLNKYDKRLDSYNGKVDKYQATIARFNDGGWTSDTYLKNVQAVKNAVNEYETLLNELKGKDVSLVTSDGIFKLDEYEKKIKDTIATVTNMSAAEKGYNFVSAQKELDKIHNLLNENSKMSSEAKVKIQAYYREIESSNPSMSLDRIHGEIMKIYNAEVEAGRAGRSFFDTLKNSGFHQLAAQMAGMFGFYDVINVVKEGIGTIRELDTALTEMRKVSNESVSTLKSYQSTTFDTADVVGTTAKQLQVSTADWMRLGESINDAAESAKDANILFNVSEFDNIDEATKSLVSMSQAYKDLGKMDIIDVLNNIGNNYSISTDGLATALKDSASALVTANNDLNEAVALTTAGNAITQDPSKVGAGLRTISLRLVGTQSAKEELESLGEDTTDVITTVSKLRDTIMEATKAATEDGKGFDILDENGNYKSTYEIMQGLADLYDKIVEKDKELGTNNLNLLLETIAGKNRSNIAASILQNGEMLKSVFEDAQNSSGSAENENKAYLESVEGRIKRLQNKIQQFWATLIDSDVVKEGVDFLDVVTSGVTKIVDKVNLIPIAISAIYSVMNNGGGLIRLIINFINNSPFLASVEFSREVYEFI